MRLRVIISIFMSLASLSIALPQSSIDQQSAQAQGSGPIPRSEEINSYIYDEKIHTTADCGKDRRTENTNGKRCWNLLGTGWYKKNKGCLSPAGMLKEKGWGLCYY